MPCSLLAASGRGYGLGFCGVCGVGKGGSLLGLTKRVPKVTVNLWWSWLEGRRARWWHETSGGWSWRWVPRGPHFLCLIGIRLGQEWGDSDQWWGAPLASGVVDVEGDNGGAG